MSTIIALKQKKNSIKSTHKITKAMEMVSTAKSRRLINAYKDYQPYFESLDGLMSTLAGETQLKGENVYNNTLWIVFSSDLGLVGGYNNTIVNKLREKFKTGDKVSIIESKPFSKNKKFQVMENVK